MPMSPTRMCTYFTTFMKEQRHREDWFLWAVGSGCLQIAISREAIVSTNFSSFPDETGARQMVPRGSAFSFNVSKEIGFVDGQTHSIDIYIETANS